ncbi:MAG TPA: S-methyl-5-thioribose kinase [Actinomycetales bacterium]|nr:S-methyl-5-thioribose kinase [Actinomycetales bacterium]
MADYTFLTVEEVPEYIRNHPRLSQHLDANNLASVNEIGDGNLNLVFIAKDTAGRGLVLKQALPYVRMTGEGWPMTPERSRFEIQSLEAHAELVPELVVRVLDKEPERYIFAMEDLSDHQVWRGALNKGEVHNGAAAEVGRYAGAVAFGTSLFGMDRLELAARQEVSVDPELCVITEDLVFTEPWDGAERNSWLPANQWDVAEFQADHRFGEAMAEAKYFFMTHAEALLHGDLHTGSVMVRKPEGSDEADSVKVFDSEFAFYGPVAFDVGATWANYVIAAARAYALGEDERARWCLGLAGETWDAFEAEFRRRWPERRDPRLWDEDFLNRLIARWRNETWLFAAAKMSRRIVGAAKTTDIETLAPEVREGAARGVLRMARSAVVERWTDSSPRHFQQLAEWLLVEARTS